MGSTFLIQALPRYLPLRIKYIDVYTIGKTRLSLAGFTLARDVAQYPRSSDFPPRQRARGLRASRASRSSLSRNAADQKTEGDKRQQSRARAQRGLQSLPELSSLALHLAPVYH